MSHATMGSAALALYVLYGALAFGLRGLLHLRRTGSMGFRGLSGRPGSAEWWGGALFAMALGIAVAGGVLASAGVLGPLPPLDHPGVQVAGFVLFMVGLAATLYAQLAMGVSWRVGVDPTERTALVTSGPFRVVRNPIYSAMLVATTGLTLIIPNAAALGGLVLLVTGLEIHVRLVEEPYLLRVHGTDYLAYASRAGRFVPFVGRLRKARGQIQGA